MKKSTKTAIAFATLAAMAAGGAIAADRGGPGGMRGDPMKHFERADADNSGDVTYEEFAAAMGDRFTKADANSDGKVTIEEMADAIIRARAERMAKRMMERLDNDGDGVLTAEEVESRQKKMFALLDRNDDGKVVKEEIPRRGWHHGDRRGGMGHHGRHERRHGSDDE